MGRFYSVTELFLTTWPCLIILLFLLTFVASVYFHYLYVRQHFQVVYLDQLIAVNITLFTHSTSHTRME